MTLSQAVRVPFSRAIANLRDDWNHAGVEAAMVELSQQIPDPGECLALMLAWARRGDARTPAGVLQPGLRTSQPAAPVTSSWTPPTCPDHPKSGVRIDGTCAGCWVDSAADTEPYRRAGGTPPPPGLRDQVAVALHQTRERSGAGNGATPGGATGRPSEETSEGALDVG